MRKKASDMVDWMGRHPIFTVIVMIIGMSALNTFLHLAMK